MEELIHHFKLFTEGMHVPAGEAYAAVSIPRASSASIWFPTVRTSLTDENPRTGFCPSGALDEMARGHMLADVVAIIGTQDIVFGEVDR